MATEDTRETRETREALAEVTCIPERTNAAARFGAPVVSGDRTVIPVAEIAYGFGVGWGGSEPGAATPGGHGGGARTRAIAVIEIAPQGVRILPIEDHTTIRIATITFASVATAILARTLLKLVQGEAAAPTADCVGPYTAAPSPRLRGAAFLVSRANRERLDEGNSTPACIQHPSFEPFFKGRAASGIV